MGIHSYFLLSRNASHRQATYDVVGKQVAPQFVGGQKGLVPLDIQNFARTHLRAKINYYKAWRGRKHAQSLIRDSPEESFYSFYMLPSYCYMLEKVNPGTVTRIEVDGKSIFKYLFLVFGVAIKGFQYMRKIISIDRTF